MRRSRSESVTSRMPVGMGRIKLPGNIFQRVLEFLQRGPEDRAGRTDVAACVGAVGVPVHGAALSLGRLGSCGWAACRGNFAGRRCLQESLAQCVFVTRQGIFSLFPSHFSLFWQAGFLHPP